MEKHFRFGLIATLALHAAVALWWAGLSRVQAPESGLPDGPVIEVQLHSEGNDGAPAQNEPAPLALPPERKQAIETSAAGRVEPQEPAVTPDDLVLPAKEPSYVASAELDVRPRPQVPVVIPFPDAHLAKSKVTGVLVLFVGADGRVDRIEVDESELPPEFERAAIETFLQARMDPGIKDGKATRARMKILVEFEAR